MFQANPRSSSALGRFGAAVLLAFGAAAMLHAQIPGRNVNMVSGESWPDGDPYLQRQNEPSLAASSRNPLHLLGGSNDYRTVDIPGLPGGGETGDAWLGLYKSLDGGQRWKSTLLPGYPQDTTAIGKASPIYGYQAAADPVVRPGTSGLFYYSGIVFDRTANGKSRVFVSRFIDNNNKEAGDPIHYLGTTPVASNAGTNGEFIDKPWIAVDVPRAGARTCSISTPGPKKQPIVQRIPAGNVYIAYTLITHSASGITGTIMFSRSTDCGVTWSDPIAISHPSDKVNQGAAVAVDPSTGMVYVSWRKFGLGVENDAIIVARAQSGARFNKPQALREFASGRSLGELIRLMVGSRRGKNPAPPVVEPATTVDSTIAPFDQPTSPTYLGFRTNSYPTMAIDGGGRVYIAWSERNFRSQNASPYDSSIVMSTGSGSAWTQAFGVDVHGNPGHQIMPSLAFAGGKLMLVYYDLREDVSRTFSPSVMDRTLPPGTLRHTIDLRATQAEPAAVPVFAPSVQVSQYVFGSRPRSKVFEQLQFNPPNLPLFQLGEVPFIGDYIDIAPAPMFVQNADGVWQYNTAPSTSPVFHTAWTDNRNVRPPPDGDWTRYTPPSGTRMSSTFDGSVVVSCEPGRAGMRNQNVYTSRISAGLLAGSPGNAKPLSPDLPRGFVVFAQNMSSSTKSFRMTIQNQPVGGRASFSQLSTDAVITVADMLVPARSTVSRTVFATSTDSRARIEVDVQETATLGGEIVVNGLTSEIILNPDIANPDIANPDIANPDIANPDIANTEVYNPDIANPDIANPDIANPDIANPDIANPDIANVVVMNPDIANPDIANPDIANPDIANPDIANPDIANPDIANGSLTDVTWTVTNEGNTTASYSIDLLGQVNIPQGIKAQLILHKQYKTPVSDGCALKYETQTILVSNIINPQILNPDVANPDIANPDIANATLWLEPGGTGKITLRVLDPNPRDNIKFDPIVDAAVTPKVSAEAINTVEITEPTAEPPTATPPTAPASSITVTGQPANAVVSQSLGNVQVRVVTTQDALTSPAANAAVAVGILTNPGGGQLAGTTTVQTDANGYANFPGLSIDRAGTGYQLVFTASSLNAVPAPSALFSVTIPDVDPGQNVFTVTTTSDSGPGSLRQAIIDANATPNGPDGPDVIAFGFRLAGPHTIALTNALPAITTPMIIDGATQSGYSSSTGQPMIHVSGASIPGSLTSSTVIGFNFALASGGSVIRALSITGFGSQTTSTGSTAIRVTAGPITIQGNWIGIAPDLSAPGNQTGIWVQSTAATAFIGGTSGAATRNVISAGRAGILANASTGSIIRGNYIGTAPDGVTSRSNTLSGISLQGTSVTNTIVGGPVAPGGYFAPDSPANIVASNQGGGIYLLDFSTSGGPVNTQILGNVVGLGVDGSDLGNNGSGILVRGASGTKVGAPGAGNVISGNGELSPFVAGGGINVNSFSGPVAVIPVIQSNLIGLDPSGTQARPNAYEGIALSRPAQVGGSGPGEGNVIAGNGLAPSNGAGIVILQQAGGSLVEGNVIGLGVDGSAVPNGYSGITIIGTDGVTIGGSTAGARNIISGNTQRGIQMQGGTVAANNITVRGNWIGTTNAGTVGNVGNGNWGIVAQGTNIKIGGPSASDANVIAGNGFGGVTASGRGGVAVISPPTPLTVATIWTNSIHDNSGLAIDLNADGVTPNDANDPDSGPNLRQNYPLLSAAASNGAGTVRISLNTAAGVYLVQVFANTACDASGYGEAQSFLLEATMTVPAAGTVVGSVTSPLIQPGQILTATATDQAGNTSEVSGCTTVGTAQPPDAVDDSASTPSGTPVVINVLGNDSDPNGDPLTVNAVTNGTNGTATNNGNGTVTYSPTGTFRGTDTFTYTINDGFGGFDTASVFVTVSNRSPTAVNDSASTVGGTAVVINVVSNDSDPEGDPLSVTAVSNASNGTVTNNGNGTVTYTPARAFSGTDTFTYTISDGAGGTAAASVVVNVTAAPAEDVPPPSPNVFYWDPVDGGNGNYYEYVLNSGLSWTAARSAAESRTYLGIVGRLVSITSAAENGFVQSLQTKMGLNDMRAWIGLWDPNGTNTWQWTSGETASYTNWYPGEPNNFGSERAVEIFSTGLWNNNQDGFFGAFGYVVEYQVPTSPAPAPTTASGAGSN